MRLPVPTPRDVSQLLTLVPRALGLLDDVQALIARIEQTRQSADALIGRIEQPVDRLVVLLDGLEPPLTKLQPTIERLAQTEKTLRLRAGHDRGAPYWELSERELEVLRLLPSSLSQREIAASLYVSFNTIRTHVSAIFRKLGVTSRAEAVARARELGLL